MGSGLTTTSSHASGRPESASSRVLALFEGHRLTPTQRRIAQCLVENAAQAAFLSSGEVANLANVSQPSVTRLAVAVGYRGYPALRRKLREAVSGVPPEGYGVARRNEWQQAVASEITNLERLSEMLGDSAPIERAAEMLMASRPLLVVGVRASAPLAGYFGYFAAKIHPDVRVVTGGGSATVDQIDQARAAGATATLVVVLPRYPVEALGTIELCRSMDITPVLLTDTPMSPVAGAAEIVLAGGVGTGLVFDSHATPMVLATILLQAMCAAEPASAQQRLERFEQVAAERDLFLP